MVAVHRHNLRSMAEHVNTLRAYALDDERGLVLCTWPHGGRPRRSFVYCDEVWIGSEYEVAAQLAFEGETARAREIVEAARARHDGIKRNPWNEVETGNHFVRSMASWALLLAWSGYRYDAANATLGFDPHTGDEPFQSLFTSASAWGLYRQRKQPDGWQANLAVHHGTLPLRRFTLRPPATADWQSAQLTADGSPVAANASQNDDGTITWELTETTTLTADLALVIPS
jgi:non-lysosomal glucosylceramidase